ncbi:MAG: hypothetical protein KBF56_02350 [Gemmatimonadaceae bacterium]|nr:hypothetical protein [Gemmatimonadaceae bacterium]
MQDWTPGSAPPLPLVVVVVVVSEVPPPDPTSPPVPEPPVEEDVVPSVADPLSPQAATELRVANAVRKQNVRCRIMRASYEM